MARLNRLGSRLDEFSRRGFLGGTGAALMVGLPMLETLWSRKARAAAAAPGTPRLLCIAAGNGLPMDELTPTGTGANYAFKQGAGAWGTDTIWRAFAPLRPKTSIITGLGVAEGRHDPGDHGCGMPAIFACTKPNPGTPRLGMTIDQVMANKYAAQTPRYPQGLQLAMSKGSPSGDGPFGSTYLTNISWRSATQPNPPSFNPQQVFQTMFAGVDPKATATQNSRTLARRTSILDYVNEEASSLLPALNKDDKDRVGQYFQAVRDFENQLKAATQSPASGGAACTAPGAGPAATLDYPSTIKAMADLVVLAFQCDLARSVMFQMSCYRNDTMYAFLNDPKVNDNHHSLSHAFDCKSADSGYRKVDRWIFDQIFYLLNKLDAIKELNGLSILDNSLAIFNSDVGDGFQHWHNALPIAIWGSAGGKFPTGRYWSFDVPGATAHDLTGDTPAHTPAAGLYVTMLNALGVDTVKTWGDTMSGPLALT
ncbi:MAG: DUF1552 domain-containing protein [Polyangia bacterium]